MKLRNIHVTPKLVKRAITNLDLSKVSGRDCVLVVVLKNFEAQLSYILAEIFNICLKEFCFQNFWKVLSVVPVFKECWGEEHSYKLPAC